jgi:ABC-type glycerol-3-phosphate transport system substrate-binding protein
MIQATTPAAGCLDCTCLAPSVPSGAPPPVLRDIIPEAGGSAQDFGRRAIPKLSRRQLVSQIAALGALVTLACRPAPPPGPPPLLTLLAAEQPYPPVQQLASEQASTAAAEAGIRLAYQVMPLESLRQKLPAALAAGQPPDLALLGGLDAAGLVARGRLVDQREALDRIAGLNGDLFPPLRALATAGPFVDRSARDPVPVWAIPYLSVSSGWLIRRDVLTQAKLALPNTFDEARQIAEKLTDPAGSVVGWGASLPPSDVVDGFGLATLLAHGVSLFDPNGLRLTLNPDEAVPALQAIGRLYRTDAGAAIAPAGVVDWSAADAGAALASGRVAQTLDLGGLYARMVADTPSLRDEIAVLPWPGGPKGRFTATPIYAFAVLAGRNAERATALIERLLQPARYDALSRAGLGSAIPPYAYQTKGPFWDEDPNYAVFVASTRGDPARGLQYAPFGYPSPPTLPVVSVGLAHALSDAVRAVALGQQSPGSAALALQKAAQSAARAGLALQPQVSPTPEPTWLKRLSDQFGQ